MKQPQVTVVVPVHNTAPYLDKCIGSILEQTFTDHELILVNNCSTDNSLELCHAWAARDSRVRVFDIPEASLAAARNKGIDAAEGRYITFVDSDDWVEPEYLAEFFRTLLPEGNVIVMQGILHDFSEYPGREGRTQPIFIYDDSACRTADGVEADPKSPFLLYAYSFGPLFDVELLRRHNIRVRQIAYHEAHLFYFDYLQHVDTVVFRPGVWAHYMIRPRMTLTNVYVDPRQAFLTAQLLRDALPGIIERFNVRDAIYLQMLYNLVLCPVDKALIDMRGKEFGYVLKQAAGYAPMIPKIRTMIYPTMLTAKLRRLLKLPEWLYFIPYAYCCKRRRSLRKRGRI